MMRMDQVLVKRHELFARGLDHSAGARTEFTLPMHGAFSSNDDRHIQHQVLDSRGP
jgi:hypothetical protein